MSLMDMWATCDRCSFKYRRRQLRVESTGFLVCRKCDDGRYDLKSHPQNKSARRRRELREVPDGTPQIQPEDNIPAVLVNLVEQGRIDPSIDFSRPQPGGSVSTFQDASGVWREAAADAPRFSGYRQRLLCEGSGTNRIQNPRCLGSVPPAALPAPHLNHEFLPANPLPGIFSRGSIAWSFDASGVLVQAAVNAPRYHFVGGVATGLLVEGQASNFVLWSRDFTNAAWVKSNMTATLTATGLTAVANSASRLTATANNATALQSITLSQGLRNFRIYARRVSGSGEVQMTINGGTTWVPITLTSSWTPFDISTTITNPQVGVRITTSGDVIEVDATQLEGAPPASTPIFNTSGVVTRLADVLSISVTGSRQTAGTFAVRATQLDAGATLSVEMTGSAGSDVVRHRRAVSNAADLVVIQNSSQVFDGDSSSVIPTGIPSTGAVVYGQVSSHYVGGSALGEYDNNAPLDAMTALAIVGTRAGFSIQNILLYTEQLTQSEAEALSRFEFITKTSLPSRWGVTLSAGLSTDVVAVQRVNGIQSVTFRVSGITSNTVYLLRLEQTSGVVVSPGESFCVSYFAREDAAPLPPDNYRLIVQGRSATGVVLGTDLYQSVPALNLNFDRYILQGQFSQEPALARGIPFFSAVFSGAGVAVDFTVTIGWPTWDTTLSTPVLPADGTIGVSNRGADFLNYDLPAAGNYTLQIAAAPIQQAVSVGPYVLASFSDGTAENDYELFQPNATSLAISRRLAGALDSTPLSGLVETGQLISAAFTFNSDGIATGVMRGQTLSAVAGGFTRGMTEFRVGQGSSGLFPWAGEIENITIRSGAAPLWAMPDLANTVGPQFASRPIEMIVAYGQSRFDNRAEGVNECFNWATISREPDLALMLNAPAEPGLPFERDYEPRWTTKFDSLVDCGPEQTFVCDVNGVDTPLRFLQLGQSAGPMLYQIIAKDRAAGIPARRWLYLAAGLGGASVSTLSKNAEPRNFSFGRFVPYNRLYKAVTQANKIARELYGVPLVVRAVLWAQGEADGLVGTNPVVYKNSLRRVGQDLINDMQYITKQSRPPVFVTDLVPPSGLGTGENTPISQAQEEFVLEDTTGQFFCIGPVYYHTFKSTSHMDVIGTVTWAEQWAEALYPLLENNVAPTWLRRGAITTNGNTITIQTIGAQGNLVLDTTTLPLAPNHGFDLSNTAATITGVSVSGTTITITCSSSPVGGTLHYAGLLAGGNNSGATGFCGAYGNVRDSYEFSSIMVPGRKLYRFLASFIVTL